MKFQKLILAGSVASALAACGGSGGGSSDTAGSSFTSGAITAFGSVYVNGTRYDTSNAAVYVEDSEASESELRVGMMVCVEKNADGSAKAIYFDDDVEGIVIGGATVNVDGSVTLNVLGQMVTVDNNTIFESNVAGITTAAGIQDGNIVEVSGSASGTGSIIATRIEVKAADFAEYKLLHPEGVELKGIVAGQDTVVQSFMIGSQQISYAGAQFDDMPGGDWTGLYVEVKSSAGLSGVVLLASKVEPEDGGEKGEYNEDDEVEVKGTISELTATSITVDGQTFLLDGNTEYELEGMTLAVNVLVEVEGHVNANGALVAREVGIEDHDEASEMEFQGAVSALVSTDINVGTFIVNSNTVIVNNRTIMHDDREAAGVPIMTHFNLSQLRDGDHVKVHVVDNRDGSYTAIKLELVDFP